MDKPKRAALSDDDLTRVPSHADWPTDSAAAESTPHRAVDPDDLTSITSDGSTGPIVPGYEPTTQLGGLRQREPAEFSELSGAEATTRIAAPGERESAADKADPTTDGATAATAKPKRHPFTRALLATGASTIVPGLGLVTAERKGPRVAGRLMVGVLAAALIGFGAWAITDLPAIAALAVNARALTIASWGLLGLALAWVAVIVGTHLIRRPTKITNSQRAVGALVVAGLSLAVSAPLAVAARYASDQANLVSTIFGDGKKSETTPTLTGTTAEDVWANKPRLNILLLGADTDTKRLETIEDRPVLTDTVMVASIDTHTGSMVLTQLPRNMAKTPFPAGTLLNSFYPYGFYDGFNPDNADYFLNAIWTHVPEAHPDAFPNSTYPGAEALKLGVGEAVGLDIDYFVMLNIDGLQQLIEAMGGVTVNINERLPMGGTAENCVAADWLEPGPNQKLDGREAMWYGRSRCSTDDYSRMARQSCLVSAIVAQANPTTILTRYEAIAAAGSEMVETDIPPSVLPAMVELALRMQGGSVKRVLFQHGVDGYLTNDPNFALMRERVADVIAATEKEDASAASTPSSSPSETPSSSASAKPSSKKPSPSASSEKPSASPSAGTDIEDACAYNPEP